MAQRRRARTRPTATLRGFDGSYVDVAGHREWHEVAGSGPAVALLHGGYGGASSWALTAPVLVEAGFRVHVPERRGHARTPDVDGPITYQAMADDTVAYLERHVEGPAHLVGWSDGAAVALLAARDRAEKITRMVLIGQYYNDDGKVADSPLTELLDSGSAMAGLRSQYAALSPDGADHFTTFDAKMKHLFATEPRIDLNSLTSIMTPTMVLQGDRDEVTLDHSSAVVAALPHARLAVLPGSHMVPAEQPDALNALLISFLRNGFPRSPWG